MKLNALLLRTLPFAALLVLAHPALADDKAAAKEKHAKPAAPDQEEMMKKWMAVATPGPEHKALEALVGDWEVASKWWMAPDAPPDESKGTSKVRSILGGRFVQEDYDGQFMGRPMHGLGLTGYDNFKKRYASLWIDDGGTAMYTSTGSATADKKSFTFNGRMDDPMSGEKNKPVKYIIRIVDANKRIFQMHEPARGEKSLVAEMTYTRK